MVGKLGLPPPVMQFALATPVPLTILLYQLIRFVMEFVRPTVAGVGGWGQLLPTCQDGARDLLIIDEKIGVVRG